jgi:5-methylcytosine-specific restriction endonuclease McrA
MRKEDRIVYYYIHKNKGNKRKKKRNNLEKLTYPEFLKSDYWRKVRNKVLERDGYKCKLCGSVDNLVVHHKTYKNHNNELKHLEDLVTVCNYCHHKIHSEY